MSSSPRTPVGIAAGMFSTCTFLQEVLQPPDCCEGTELSRDASSGLAVIMGHLRQDASMLLTHLTEQERSLKSSVE